MDAGKVQGRVLVCFFSFFLTFSAAQTGKIQPLPLEDALKTRSFADISGLVFSPDGEWLAYTVLDNLRHRSGPDRLATSGSSASTESDLFVSSVRTGYTKNITGQYGENWSPKWSPDGRYVGFLSDRGGASQPVVMGLGEALLENRLASTYSGSPQQFPILDQ